MQHFKVMAWLCCAGVLLALRPAAAAVTEAATNPWPFAQPAQATLRASQKMVFAHYFIPFPLSIDNRSPEADYYAKGYLAPGGENGKHLAYGGYLRQRPLPQAPRTETNWRQLNLETEVRRAAALGMDGFAVDILSSNTSFMATMTLLLDAAQHVAPGFKIMLMPDMESEFRTKPENMAVVIRTLAKHPSVYRLADGRLVIAPYNAQRYPAAWWQQQLESLKAEGIDIAFLPLFQGWNKFAADYAPISMGMSDWGPRSPTSSAALKTVPAEAHKYTKIWLMPVSPQDYRPKSQIYWEAANSLNYRTMWQSAIEGGADWVHLITWNDYSEATEISPSSGTQYAFYDLTAYYIAWFKTGNAPKITQDALYYFHRIAPMTAQPDATKQPKLVRCVGPDASRDEVELLAFLTKPGTLEIELAGKVSRMDAPAGLTSFRVPMVAGRPIYRLLRKQQPIITVEDGWTITDKIDYQDGLYRGGSSNRPFIALPTPAQATPPQPK